MDNPHGLGKYSIIWNITNRCYYNCNICATYDNSRTKLDHTAQLKVLSEIVKFPVMNLDFAGGDPLFDNDSKKTIVEAISLLGKESVTVTTTGHSVNSLTTEEKAVFLYQCEFTLDCNNQTDDLRCQLDYCISNYQAMMDNAKYIKKLTINVPILDTEIDKDILVDLINKINSIPVANKTVSLIRLMPVGKMIYLDYPTKYDYEKIVDIFKKFLSPNSQLHLQCALRGLESVNNCGMVRRKFGIDCSGNVFSCAWGGYIFKENNPFFLGNLMQSSLEEILTSEKAKSLEIISKNSNGNCCLFQI